MIEENEKQLLKFIKDLQQQYKDLILDEIIIEDIEIDCLTERIQIELEKFPHLQSLQINKCGLKSLGNLPKHTPMVRLCFDHNQLSGKELAKLSQYPNLIALSIIDNKFENMDDIKQLALCTHLSQLNAYKNPVADQPKFRQETFELLSSLILLDNLSKTGDEIQLNEDIKINKNVTLIDPVPDLDKRKIIS